MTRADGAPKSCKPPGTNYEALFTVHGPDYTTLVRKKQMRKKTICLKMTNRYKKDKTFRSLTVDQSYIATVACDSSSVETRLARVRTYMTEKSSDSLANSLPRPSKCFRAEAGRGGRSASTRLLSSPRRWSRLRAISVHDTMRRGWSTARSVESWALSSEILPCSELITRTHPTVKHAALHKRSRPVICCLSWINASFTTCHDLDDNIALMED